MTVLTGLARIMLVLALAEHAEGIEGNTPALRGGISSGKSNNSRFFLWLSDAHFDPYYGTDDQQCSNKNASATAGNKFGTFGCDAPYALLKSAVQAAADLHAEFVLFTGDFTRHDQNKLSNPSSNVSDIIGEVSQLMSEGFPALVSSDGFVMGALGNDDSPLDYELNITTDSATNAWLTNIGGVLAAEGVMQKAVHRKYDYGGFFNTSLGGIEILSLDTVIYSKWHVPAASLLPKDPFNQLAWLRLKLESAAAEGRSVWIVGHIPPGMETYGYTELWHEQYVKAYLELVEDAHLGRSIAAQLFGHVHKEELRVMPRAPAGAGPVFTMGSISPVYNNNPSFRLVEYDASTGRMLDYSDYYAELPDGRAAPVWKLGYRASEMYRPFRAAKEAGGITNQAAQDVAALLALGGSVFSSYATWYATNRSSDLVHCAASLSDWQQDLDEETKTRCVRSYLCALSITARDLYQNCTADLIVQNVSKPRHEDFEADVPAFYETARAVHLTQIGINTLWEGGGFA